MKKVFALLLALVMVLSLAACGGGDDEKTPSSGDKTPSSSQQQQQNTPAPDEGEDEPSDPNAPVSSIKNLAGRTATKHNAEDAQELLVSMGLPEYPGGEILYANEFEEGDGSVYIKDTTLDECVSYCQSLSGVSPAYADSNSNGKYVNYACEGNGFAFTIKFFAEEQERSYKLNGNPVTDVWQVEIDFTPTGSGSGDATAPGDSDNEPGNQSANGILVGDEIYVWRINDSYDISTKLGCIQIDFASPNDGVVSLEPVEETSIEGLGFSTTDDFTLVSAKVVSSGAFNYVSVYYEATQENYSDLSQITYTPSDTPFIKTASGEIIESFSCEVTYHNRELD